MRAKERRSDVESELTSDDPTDLDDMVFFDEEENREVVVTSAVRRDPMAMSPWFLCQGSVRGARTMLASEQRSGHGHRASWWCHRSCCRLWRMQLGEPGGPRSRPALVRRRG